ncbi:phosphatidylinositol-3-phosphatase myotubularin-1 [Selaginella moellendorffii]|uniref:phosphatidylinositol-3-phosphatase myotubularin-1 n=1 Tax=Selaginella moellendorffii TaxID=88036 RepID=UPI000D1C2BFB|nr:phosphatidylinositol-3-phosphatase myotubularin-1 [Selaginella moellendorffii]|eukprot:XP_024526893.1 phosphatidylinositol-3-phosphatase myotubularin-1 [Selaginella moellendorffii]
MEEACWHDWTTVEAKQVVQAGPTVSKHGYGLLLPGEDAIAESSGVLLVNIDRPGTLLLTSFRLVFLHGEQVCNMGTIPLATIEKFSKQQAVRPPGPRSSISPRRLLQIVGKDLRTIVFGFSPHVKHRRIIFDALQRLTRPARLWDLYAFSAEWAKSCLGFDSDPRVRLQSEYERIISHHKSYWTLSDVNSDYMLCATYPSLLVMPKSLSNEEFQQGADFRARGRLPTLSWQHPDNGAVLARSSQPLVGIMMNSRSIADEKLVAALCGRRRKLYIVDARPRKNALANGAMGGGSESSANYSHCEVVFLGIDNIHAMRDSLGRLRDYLDTFGASSSDGSSSLLRGGGSIWGGGNFSSTAAAVSALGDSGWLTHIHNLLAGAAWIVARIAVEGASVLVHCSDGWDRTTQLVSLAQLMLDPYYRTFAGFQALIEKDWLAFGHPFADRLGTPTMASSESVRSTPAAPARPHPNPNTTSGTTYDTSPIFLQWFDCVSQLVRLYHRAFEFSGAFLVEFMDSVLSCRFGNFLCNSEKERVQARIAESACIWTHFRRLQSVESKYNNCFYIPASRLLPSPAALAPSLWPEYYLRWNFHPEKSSGYSLQDHIQDEIRGMFQRASSSEQGKNQAENKVQNLMSIIDALHDELEGEKRARALAVADAIRARKETAFIKHAVETLGCEISFPSPEDLGMLETQLYHQRQHRHRQEQQDQSSAATNKAPDVISVSVVSGIDISARQAVKKEAQGDAKDSCNWPKAQCPRSESAVEQIRVDYDALEQLSMDDLYFQSSLQAPRLT